MEMNVSFCEETTYTMFKIDLIVWKSHLPDKYTMCIVWFKIDLIVWK